MEIPIVGLRPPGNDVWGGDYTCRGMTCGVWLRPPGDDVGCWELCGKRKFPIYNIGSAENDIFLTFSQKKLSFAF